MFGKKESKLELNLRGCEKISGSDFLVTRLTSQESGFKGNIHRITHNLLFINSNNFSTRWLFASNNQLIETFYQIPLDGNSEHVESYDTERFQPFRDSGNDSTPPNPTGWLLYVYTTDTAIDDTKAIAISDISGNDLTMILDRVETTFDKVRINKDELILLYRSNQQNLISKIRLSESKVTQTKELPKIQ